MNQRSFPPYEYRSIHFSSSALRTWTSLVLGRNTLEPKTGTERCAWSSSGFQVLDCHILDPPQMSMTLSPSVVTFTTRLVEIQLSWLMIRNTV